MAVARAGPTETVCLVSFGVLSGVAAAPAAWLTKLLVDGLGRGNLSSRAAALLAAGAALLAAAGTLAAYVSAIAGVSLEAKTKLWTELRLARACSLPAGTRFLEAPELQDQLHLARRGAELVPQAVPPAIVEIASGVAALSGYGVVLWASWPWMVVAMLAVAVPSAFLQRRISLATGRQLQAASSDHRWHSYYAGLFSDPSSARDLRLHGAMDFFLVKLRHSLEAALRREVSAQNRATASKSAIVLLQSVLSAGGAAIVALAVVQRRATVGEFVLFSAAVVTMQARISSMLNQGPNLAMALSAFSSLEQFTKECDAAAASPARHSIDADQGQSVLDVPPLRDCVAFSDVWFRYADDAPWVLRGVTFELRAGQVYGLVGLNGAGKSTIIKLLLRFYEPQQGAITWDGIDIQKFEAHAYRRRLTGVLQDRVRYEATLSENVRLGDLDLPEADATVTRAIAAAGLDQTMTEKGLDGATLLSTTRRDSDGHTGTLLSGGQWERVALARVAFNASADLEVLDEPNAGLDPLAEAELRELLVRRHRSRTKLLVSHRLNTLVQADQTLVVSGGRIVESGSHDELMHANGLYATLVRSQAPDTAPVSTRAAL